MLTQTTSASARARATSARWPACSAPIVGTSASGPAAARRAVQSAGTARTISIVVSLLLPMAAIAVATIDATPAGPE